MGIASFSGASSVIKPGVVTSSTRPSSPFVGQLIYETDTARLAAYNGSAWVSQNSLQYITGASFTAASTVSLPTNTFTANYRNYRAIYEVTGSSTTTIITGRLRASGADLTGASYNYGAHGIKNDATTNLFADLNATSTKLGFGIANGGVDHAILMIDFISPQLSDKTMYATIAYYQDSTSSPASMNQGGGLYNVATAADSFTIISSAGTITGVYRVYGLMES